MPLRSFKANETINKAIKKYKFLVDRQQTADEACNWTNEYLAGEVSSASYWSGVCTF